MSKLEIELNIAPNKVKKMIKELSLITEMPCSINAFGIVNRQKYYNHSGKNEGNNKLHLKLEITNMAN